MVIEKPLVHDLMHDLLVQAGRMQIACLLRLHQFEVQAGRRNQVAHSQPGCQHLGKRAEIDNVLRGHREQRGQRV